MELKDVIEKRSSVRTFTNEPVPKDTINEMIRRAGLAPSIANSQPWKFIAISNKETLSQMADIVKKKLDELFPDDKHNDNINIKNTVKNFSTFFANAPAFVVVTMKPYEAVVDNLLPKSSLSHDDMNRLRNHPNIQSIGACVENLLLSAVDLGFDACWVTGWLIAQDELEAFLKIHEPFSIVAGIALGKAAEDVSPKEKKNVNEIISFIE